VIGIIGILGCMMAIAAGAMVASACVSIGTSIYGAHKADEQADKMDEVNKKNEDRTKVQERISREQNAKSIRKAAQMAVTGTMIDDFATKRTKYKTDEARRDLRRTEGPSHNPRPVRNFGTPAVSNTIKT